MKTAAIFYVPFHNATRTARLRAGEPYCSSWIKIISGFLSRNVKRRSMIRSLEQLDDHLLADIGLQRQSIEHAVDRFLECGDP
jgi:uncharacterized protein YjiS (DUF1127 family)